MYQVVMETATGTLYVGHKGNSYIHRENAPTWKTMTGAVKAMMTYKASHALPQDRFRVVEVA